MLGPRERDEHRAGAADRAADDDADVARRLLEEGQDPGILEQPVRCVDEQEVDVVLGREARQVDARRQ